MFNIFYDLTVYLKLRAFSFDLLYNNTTVII